MSSDIQRQDLQPLRVPSQIPILGLRSLKVWNFLIYRFFFQTLDKIKKNVISRKLHGFEQSYLAAKIATPKRTLTEPHYRDGNFKFIEVFISKFSEKIWEKKSKKRLISKSTRI